MEALLERLLRLSQLALLLLVLLNLRHKVSEIGFPTLGGESQPPIPRNVAIAA